MGKKKMFPVENFLVTHISVLVEEAKHQVAVCLLSPVTCVLLLKVTVSNAEILQFRFHNT